MNNQKTREKASRQIPTTAYLFIFGVSLLLAGFLLAKIGFETKGAITGALALFIIALVLVFQVVIWGLGKLN